MIASEIVQRMQDDGLFQGLFGYSEMKFECLFCCNFAAFATILQQLKQWKWSCSHSKGGEQLQPNNH